MSDECTHLDQIVIGVAPGGDGCKECMETGGRWVHLRRCAVCGHIGCCDSSPGKHATKHAHETGHAIMQSYEPGEDWAKISRSGVAKRPPSRGHDPVAAACGSGSGSRR